MKKHLSLPHLISPVVVATAGVGGRLLPACAAGALVRGPAAEVAGRIPSKASIFVWTVSGDRRRSSPPAARQTQE